MKIGKFFSLALVLVLCFALLCPPAALADDTKVTEDGIEYTVNGGEVTIVGYKKKLDQAPSAETVVYREYELTIPAEIEDLPVTKIGAQAFKSAQTLVSLTIDGGESLVLEREAFSSCGNLKKLVVTGGVDLSGYGAFLGCYSLADLTLGEGLTGIGEAAFWRCNSLVSVVLPEGVVSIAEDAFSECTLLASLSLPKSAVDIDSKAFRGLPALSHVSVAAGNPLYISSGDCLIDVASKTLVLGTISSVIPADGSVKSIGEAAFLGRKITSVDIPDCIESIGDEAFCVCDVLKSAVIPGSVKSLGRAAFAGCESLGSVVVCDGVKTIGNGVFRNCNLKSFYLPKSVESIGYEFFGNNGTLEKLNYAGTEADWNRIEIDPGNDELFALEIVFESGSAASASASESSAPASSAAASTAKHTDTPASTAKKTEAPASTAKHTEAPASTTKKTEAPASTAAAPESTVPASVSAPASTEAAPPESAPASVSESAAVSSSEPGSGSVPASPSASESPALGSSDAAGSSGASVSSATAPASEPSGRPGALTVVAIAGATLVLAAGAFFGIRKLRAGR